MQVPTYKEIYEAIVEDIQSEFNISLPTFGKNFFRAFAAVQAAKIWSLYQVLSKLQKNVFVDTAEPEAFGGTLERFGRVKLNRNPNPATQGVYKVEIEGNAGATIPAGQTFQTNDSATNPGFNFVRDNAFTFSTNVEQLELRALEAGSQAKQVVNDVLEANTPIAGVNDTATIVAEVQVPIDAETIEQYRKKTLQAFRLEPQGGAAADFRLWSLDADGVRTSYPYTEISDATDTNVVVFVEATAGSTAQGALQGVPPTSVINEVEAVIEKDPDTSLPNYKRGRVPISAFNWKVEPIEALPVTITVNGYDDPGNSKAAITTAIENRLNETRPFIGAIDTERNRQDVLNENQVVFEIQNINPRIRLNSITIEVDGTVYNSYQFGVTRKNGTLGEIPVLNNVNFA